MVMLQTFLLWKFSPRPTFFYNENRTLTKDGGGSSHFCSSAMDADFESYLIKRVPSLQTLYVPTRFWGFDGHAQTILHSVVGRMKSPWPRGERSEIFLQDGSMLTYDVYQRLSNERGDVTIVIVPGICNSSESVYVRTFVYYAQCHGYRCAVLNHLGALESVKLTAPRIFTYGHTDDLRAVVKHVSKRYPSTKVILLGYSLGGNLITKYLGEEGENVAKNIAGGVSVCQGYDVLEGTRWLLQWSNFRRIYLYFITEAVKALILRHRKILLSEPTKQKYQLNEKDIVSAATLPELDEAYTRKVHNFKSVTEFYQWTSSINYLSQIQVPQLFLNALDDPLIPEPLLVPIRDHAQKKLKTAYIETDYGGHLAFYEGGFIFPNTITWLDRTLLNAIGALDELEKTQLIEG
ncbi:alpha/beta hydrolase fold [Nesidiocoris tenuis]|uniref:Alpha/beta hydrolase fold n=1 Tax=Nesidiocoris tenuis TaxID=355587 RepID=A0ABN7BDH4_9HEMI|nr:alpha/beta hydrolase fold [Nesidiocoris tenuis]